MALFGCTFEAPGCNQAPEEFKKTVSIGNRFKAAAFTVISGSGQAFVLQELGSNITDKDAKEKVMKQLVPGGTLGKNFPEKLKLLDFKRFDQTSPPFFTAAEVLVDKGGLLRSETIVAAPSQAEAPNHFATLGLRTGASHEVVRSAWASACIRHHPDKGGDAQKFIQVTEAYRALVGTEAVVTQTPPKALTYEASPAALRAQLNEANEVVRALEQQLKIAKKHRDQVGETFWNKNADVKTVTQRAEAQRVVEKNFGRSAAYWDPVELRRWFRVHQGNLPNCGVTDPKFQKWATEMRELGDDLRSGNEDLDPVVKFVAWRHGRWAGDTELRLKVGMDLEDTVDNGITLDMKLNVYGNVHTTSGKKLLAMGFPLGDPAWLYTRGTGNWCTAFDFSYERAQEAERIAKREEAEKVAKREAKKGRKRERSPVMDHSGIIESIHPEVAAMIRRRRLGLPFE